MTRLGNFDRSGPVSVSVDGCELAAHPGETLAAVLLAARTLRFRDDRNGQPRGPFCNMGTCCECMVWVAGEVGFERRRACLVPVTAGMRVVTQDPDASHD